MKSYNTPQRKIGCWPTISELLLLVALSAATVMMVNECQRSRIRLKKDREAYEKMYDTIQNQMSDTTTINFSKEKK
ncbi:MAG: hypothetical protein K5912_00035 [Alphaproteobacteria bacterium]|nr:hypothetical protein [Alphaproteobacteria bacterium]